VALEDRIPVDHPLRGVRNLVDAVLAGMSKDFDGLYSQVGRPWIAPERLLRALLLQVFYSVRSGRLLMEQLNYNLLFRWFVGLEIDDAVWNHAVFSKNRDHRNGLIAAAMTTQADGTAERDAALLMLHELTRKRSGRITTGADKGYDTRDFVSTVRELGVTPHVARRPHGAIDERTSRHPGYAISLSKRWLVEKPFGWLKQIGPLKKVKLRGLAKVDWLFVFSCAAFNLIRIPKLRAQGA